MLCFCVSQMNILQLLRQRKLRDGNQPNSVSDNVHDYSSSLAAPVSADPNSCQSNKYSLPCFEFSSIKFAMQLESLYLTWFMCNSFLWTYSWLHVLSAQLHQDSSTYLPHSFQTQERENDEGVEISWRTEVNICWDKLKCFVSNLPIKSELWDKLGNGRNSTRIHL